jgi:hypothetical protein
MWARFAAYIAISLSVVALLLWHFNHDLPEPTFLFVWMPNVGTSLGFIGLSLLVFDQLFERSKEERMRERVLPMTRWRVSRLQSALIRFANAAAYDYASTHNTNFAPIPERVDEALVRWRQGLTTEESASPRTTEAMEFLVHSASILSRELVPDPQYGPFFGEIAATLDQFQVESIQLEEVAPLVGEPSQKEIVDRVLNNLAAQAESFAHAFVQMWAYDQALPDRERVTDGSYLRVFTAPGVALDPLAIERDIILGLKLLDITDQRPGGLYYKGGTSAAPKKKAP